MIENFGRLNIFLINIEYIICVINRGTHGENLFSFQWDYKVAIKHSHFMRLDDRVLMISQKLYREAIIKPIPHFRKDTLCVKCVTKLSLLSV